MYGSPPRPPPPPPHHHPLSATPTRDLNRPFQMSSGLLRYRSAPSSLLGEVCEDFLPIRATSPDTDSIFARFLVSESPQSAAVPAPPPRNAQLPPPPPPASAASASSAASAAAAAAAAAAAENSSNSLGFPSAMMYRHQNPVPNQQMAMESEQMKNSSNLLRQSSSPAGLFSHISVENGYGVMRGINSSSNEGGGGGGNRLKSQLSFSSSRQSSLLSQISEIENESIGGYPLSSSWEESPLLSPNHFATSGLKRLRDNSVTENGELRNGLSHQFSMPKTSSSEMAAIDKFLQFQDSVPCKIRAKRGCATHPRSIAERVRRTRISERMRKLQELVPNMDKQTNTADMLDLAVDYIKDLQKQVKTLSDNRASCTCSSSKHKPYTSENA